MVLAGHGESGGPDLIQWLGWDFGIQHGISHETGLVHGNPQQTLLYTTHDAGQILEVASVGGCRYKSSFTICSLCFMLEAHPTP